MCKNKKILKEDIEGLKFLIKEYKKQGKFKKMAECEKELEILKKEISERV